jgi:hypothetical protein
MEEYMEEIEETIEEEIEEDEKGFMDLYLIRDSVTSFSLLIAAESESKAIWHWCRYFNNKNDNPVEIERIDISTSGIVWHCGWTND